MPRTKSTAIEEPSALKVKLELSLRYGLVPIRWDLIEVRFGGAERVRTAASQFCRLLP